MRRVLHFIGYIVLVTAVAYLADVVYAYPHDHEAHISQATVAKIEAQKLTPADTDGLHLPPPPEPQKASATIAGIDANDNGIRDDVELAIFAKYPTSSATSTALRAAELQYAMDLQIQLTEVFDTGTWEAATQQRDRGFGCLYDSSNNYDVLEREVEGSVLNTAIRKKQFNSVEQFRISYKLPSGPDCDVRS